MPLDVTCPGCRADYSLSDNLNGKRIRCKQCGAIFLVGDEIIAAPVSRARAITSRTESPGTNGSSKMPPVLPAIQPVADASPAPRAASTSRWWLLGGVLGTLGLAFFCCGGTALGIAVLAYSGRTAQTAETIPSETKVPDQPVQPPPAPIQPMQPPPAPIQPMQPPPAPVQPAPVPDPPMGGDAVPWDQRLNALRGGKFIAPPRANGDSLYLEIRSDPKTWVTQGKNYSLRGELVSVKMAARPQGTVITASADGWDLELSGPNKAPLKCGQYLGAKRFPFNGNDPGLTFSGHGRGHNSVTGQFVVWELEANEDNIVRLAVDFVLSGDKDPPIYGMLRYHSTLD